MKKGLSKFPLSGREVAASLAVMVSFGIGLLDIYLSIPPSDYSFLKLPRTLEELQTLSVLLTADGCSCSCHRSTFSGVSFLIKKHRVEAASDGDS
ncbi:hypothetical protein KSP40_PGU011971 [Platanthera guangdongensis]|uniref:Uncharacterized protein n=1 Tax=Platanthera guangdongensis TaxID=2320717 RepID=A0ABR2MC95_9ASPA